MFTVEQRDAARDRVLRLAADDARVVAGAAVGSLAVDGGGDRHSDLDLTFAVVEGAAVLDVLDHWTRTLGDDLDAVHLVDLPRDPTVYRVFLLPGALQLDLSMSPAASFRPGGPRFRLLFGEVAAPVAAPSPASPGYLAIPTPAVARDIFGWGVIYALHARACIERGRPWQAEHYVGALRDHGLALACMREGVIAVQARGYDDLSRETLVRFAGTHVAGHDPGMLRAALSASLQALLREGDAAGLAHATGVAERLTAFP